MRRLFHHRSWTVIVTLVAMLLAAACGGDSSGPPRVASLRFVNQPTAVTAGQPFSASVELLDRNGERITSAKDSVTLGTASGLAFTGGASVAAVSGLASFGPLTFSRTEAGVRLVASKGDVSLLGAPFNVVPGVPTLQQSSVTPSAGPFIQNVPVDMVFAFRDALGNPSASQAVSLTTSLAGATFTPATGITTGSGNFTTSFLPTQAGTATMTATVGATALTFGSSFLVEEPCAPDPMTFPATTGGSLPDGPCVLNTFPSTTYTFTMPDAGAALFNVTASFRPALEVSSHPPADNIVIVGAGNAASGEWLLPQGTYQVRVGAANGGGSFTLTGSSGAGVTPGVIRNLAVAGTYSQSLGPGDLVLNVFPMDNSFWDIFLIQSARPCTITLRSPVLDMFLMVADLNEPDVPFDFSEDDGGGVNGTDAQLTLAQCRGPSGGRLMILANHYATVATGAYTVEVAFTSALTAAQRAVSRSPVRNRRGPVRDMKEVLRALPLPAGLGVRR